MKRTPIVGSPEDKKIGKSLIGIIPLDNGDVVALQMPLNDTSSIVLLSHDDDRAHGWVLGWSLIQFLDHMAYLGWIDVTGFSLAPFMVDDDESKHLDIGVVAAAAWRSWLGIEGKI